MKTGSDSDVDVSCASWRLGVEAHNLINWQTVPLKCQEYIASYLLDGQYRSDSKTVCREAYFYAKKLNLTNRDIFIFDVDETLLSNLPYFANHGFGVEPHNKTAFSKWVASGEAFALPETLKLYNKILSLGIKVVFLSERRLDQKDVLVKNLKDAGYPTWEKLIVRDPASFGGDDTFEYKSAERVKLVGSGYRIIGNIGDQWSDIVGRYKGFRTFKLPNPLYYS
uniref:Stem 28 kDa glycoprotein n=2 Tax=Cajanus cajan TaxID=3821 RepID=A0A151SH06_CAJCA|nr:Stem 28 kDa glycoprotein [Cajanus cajan]